MKETFILWLFFAGNIAAYGQSTSPESAKLKKMTGRWNVTMTMYPAAGAKPTVINKIIAERMMVGDYCLNEMMHNGPSSKTPPFERISDLAYNKNEMRWDYMSVDTRITAGIMYFTYAGSTPNTINSFIISFPHPGLGPNKAGRGAAVYCRNEIVKINNNHDLVRQYWRLTDKPEWLAVEYDYVREK